MSQLEGGLATRPRVGISWQTAHTIKQSHFGLGPEDGWGSCEEPQSPDIPFAFSISSMQNYGVTSLVGGVSPGTHFTDVYYMNHDGKFLLNNAAHSILNTTHPIHQIAVSSGVIVDGVSVTYQLEGGKTTLMKHGSAFNPPSGVVSFGANEVLAGVYGREGYHTLYKRTMVTNIAFVVFDTNTEKSRTVGPFGNGDNTNQGKPFWVSDVLAIGSFAQNTTHYGLSGLFFYRNPSNTTNMAVIPAAAQAGNMTDLD